VDRRRMGLRKERKKQKKRTPESLGELGGVL
jgi:hypothetical protein